MWIILHSGNWLILCSDKFGLLCDSQGTRKIKISCLLLHFVAWFVILLAFVLFSSLAETTVKNKAI